MQNRRGTCYNSEMLDFSDRMVSVYLLKNQAKVFQENNQNRVAKIPVHFATSSSAILFCF